jgi:imidazolonepropionase-like amidohydrolase
MSLACLGSGLRAAEAFSAATINAAWVLGMDDFVGRLAPGYHADIVLCDQPSITHVAYHVGSPAIRAVYVGGRLAAADGRVQAASSRAPVSGAR